MPPRDPFTEPFCQKEDLGLAIPESDHAVSVCLPRWQDVIAYEEGEPEAIDALECGYPRFLPHPFVTELFLAAQEEFGKKNETALVFPSLAAAWRCAEYVKRRTGASSRLESYGWENLTVVLLEEASYEAAWKYWQHSGEIVSSRLAESALTDAPLEEGVSSLAGETTCILKERIASFYEGIEASDVFLFSTGMGSVSAVHRILTEGKEEPTIQIEFPYLDSFKVQEQFGGVVDFSVTESGGMEESTAWFKSGKTASAIFTELPSNPLLRTPNLKGIASLAAKNEVPLAVDDTVATSVNVDPFRYADVVTTSLTKTFSGAGDVAAGAVIVKPGTPWAEALHQSLRDEEAASPLFVRDAIALERNSRHFEERVRATNEIAAEVIPALRDRPEIAKFYFPSTESRDYYDEVRRSDGGFGALFSMELTGGEAAASKFYDALPISKGPSLGTDFSLACPYTLLAHYGELDWAAKRGAKRDLLRIWIGLEDPEDLIERFECAFSAI